MSITRIVPAPRSVARMLASRVNVLAVDSPGRSRAYFYSIALPNSTELRIEIGELPGLAQPCASEAK